MTEHLDDHDLYFQHDLALGEALILGERTTIRTRLHVAEEPARGREELLPRVRLTGTRRYLHLKPYTLEPAFSLTVDPAPRTAEPGAIGQVVAAAWDGLRHVEIGEAQAWGSPTSGPPSSGRPSCWIAFARTIRATTRS